MPRLRVRERSEITKGKGHLLEVGTMGVWLHRGDQLFLEMPSESERCTHPFPFLPSFVLQSPPVLLIGQSQPKPADQGACGRQAPANCPDWGRERTNTEANGSWANTAAYLLSENGQQIPPARANLWFIWPSWEMTVKGDSQYPTPHFLPEDGAPLAILKQSSCGRVGSGQPVPAHSREPLIHPGYPSSSPPALPRPQSETGKGYTDLRVPPVFAAPELFLYLISSHYCNLHTSAEHISVQNTNQEQ